MTLDRYFAPTITDLNHEPQLAALAILHNALHPAMLALRAAHPFLALADAQVDTTADAAACTVLLAATALQELLLAYRYTVNQPQLQLPLFDEEGDSAD